MENRIKVYKPSKEEIIRNVLGSFEMENIKFSYSKVKETLAKVLATAKTAKR